MPIHSHVCACFDFFYFYFFCVLLFPSHRVAVCRPNSHAATTEADNINNPFVRMVSCWTIVGYFWPKSVGWCELNM